MQIGDTIQILIDVKTKTDKKVRVIAKAGDKVRIVAIHQDVLIVEGKERFSIHIDNVK